MAAGNQKSGLIAWAGKLIYFLGRRESDSSEIFFDRGGLRIIKWKLLVQNFENNHARNFSKVTQNRLSNLDWNRMKVLRKLCDIAFLHLILMALHSSTHQEQHPAAAGPKECDLCPPSGVNDMLAFLSRLICRRNL